MYVKTWLGNKRFVIEWTLEVDHEEVMGDAFAVDDSTPVSMSVLSQISSGPAILSKLYASNHAGDPAWFGRFIVLRTTGGLDTFVTPQPDVSVPLPAPSRWIFPRAEGPDSVGTVRVAILFEEV